MPQLVKKNKQKNGWSISRFTEEGTPVANRCVKRQPNWPVPGKYKGKTVRFFLPITSTKIKSLVLLWVGSGETISERVKLYHCLWELFGTIYRIGNRAHQWPRLSPISSCAWRGSCTCTEAVMYSSVHWNALIMKIQKNKNLKCPTEKWINCRLFIK